MDIQLAHIRIEADEAYPNLPTERPYALVLIAYDETGEYWRRGLAERLAVGGCVQVNIWGEDTDEWQSAIESANAFAVMTEERSECIPDIVVSAQSDRIIDDVFAYASARMGDLEIENVDLMVVLEIGHPGYRYDIKGLAHRAAADYGMQAALAC